MTAQEHKTTYRTLYIDCHGEERPFADVVQCTCGLSTGSAPAGSARGLYESHRASSRGDSTEGGAGAQ